jgi:hypothetical protein
MQGDSIFYGGVTYQAVDDQRSKCNLCHKVIYKLLQKAHTTSHGVNAKATFIDDKNSAKAVKKISLNFGESNSEPLAKSNLEKPLMNFEQMLKSNQRPSVELPQKTRSESFKPIEKRNKPSFSFYIKQSRQCQSALSRLCFVYERSCNIKVLKGYRKWKKGFNKNG